jgi:hypothetical protein
MEDGGALWASHLTGPENALWSLGLSEHYLFAYPGLPGPSEQEIESMPLVVRKKETGALLQRFLFDATTANVHLRLDARGALVATPRVLWALTLREAAAGKAPVP